MITIKLLDKISVIEGRVNKAISEHINSELSRKQNQIINSCKSLVTGWISAQPEIQSLESSTLGSLAGQFGLYAGSGSAATNVISLAIRDSIRVNFKKFSPKLEGGFEVNFQPADFTNILNLPQSVVNYKDGVLPWLDWLLLRGNSIIVVNYHYNAVTGLGRSGLGNMIDGGSFRVPPQFSGTSDNNFITRALVGETQTKKIGEIFQRALR